MSNLTQFSADFTQLTLSKKTKIVLEMPEGTAFSKLAEIAQHRGERIIVQFGNPQMQMDFKPQDGGNGLIAKVDSNGIVVSAEREDHDAEPEDEANDLFDQADQDAREQDESTDSDTAGADPDEEPFEVDDSDDEDPVEPEDEAEGPEPEAIEEYILNEQPSFPAIPFNFPELLRQRRHEDVKWMDLAKREGIPSTQLQSAWRKYRELVVKQMRDQGVA